MKALPLFLITLPGFLLLWLGADEREVVNGEKLQLKPTTLALPIQSPVLRSKKAVRKVESNLSDAFRSPPPQPIPVSGRITSRHLHRLPSYPSFIQVWGGFHDSPPAEQANQYLGD